MTIAGPCAHHWIIEPPNGPTSLGRCRKCGLERDGFGNSEETVALAQLKWGDRPVSRKSSVKAPRKVSAR